MTTETTLEQETKVAKPNGGMVLYPRHYELNDDHDLSFVRGVNERNEPCVFYLQPSSAAKDNAKNSETAQSVPKLAEFAETHRRAIRPCFVDDENCPQKPTGILLMEQILPMTNPPHEHDVPVYVARWASVLRESQDMPLAPIGLGFIETTISQKSADNVNELMHQYKELEAAMIAGTVESMIDADEQKQALYKQIIAGSRKWFVAVMLRPGLTQTLTNISIEGLRAAMTPFLEKYTQRGMYGSCYVRVSRNNIVDTKLSAQCDMQFDYAEKCVASLSDILDNFIKWNSSRIISAARNDNTIIIDIIPAVRINCGKMSNDKYAKELASLGSSSKLMKAYIDRSAHGNPFSNFKKECQFLFCKMAIRPVELYKNKADAGNILASSIHAYSAPIGNVYCIGRKGELAYQLDRARNN